MSEEPYLIFDRACKAFDAGDHHAALAALDKILENDSRNSSARYLRGQIYSSLGEYDLALENLTISYESDPHDYETLIELGNAYYDLGDLLNAERVWREAVDLRPDYGLAFNNLGIMYHVQRDYANAVSEFSAGIRVIEFLPLYKGRALANMKLGNFRDAIIDLDVCIEEVPDAAVLYWYRAQCHRGNGELDLALKDATSAFELDPKNDKYIRLIEDIRAEIEN